MITGSAMLDVPRPLAQYLGRLLQDDRRARGTRRGRRALTAFAPAVFVLRWFRQDTALTALAMPASRSPSATGTSREGIDVLAAQAPELPDVLRDRFAADETHVILHGTLIPSDEHHGADAPGARRRGPDTRLPVCFQTESGVKYGT